jgi:hypothetical protein
MANRYPLVSNQSTLTIEELPIGDTLLADNLTVTGDANVIGNLTVTGSINANLGNLVVENLTVEGESNLGAVGNVTITGGGTNYVLRTDGAGNLSWANIQTEIANPAGSNTQVQFNSNGIFGASANLTFNNATNTLGVTGALSVTGNANVGNLNVTRVGATTVVTTTGNITTLNAGTSNLGPVANVHISGGANGYVLATNGSGDLSWVYIDPSVSGDGGNASSSLLLLASLNGGNAISS